MKHDTMVNTFGIIGLNWEYPGRLLDHNKSCLKFCRKIYDFPDKAWNWQSWSSEKFEVTRNVHWTNKKIVVASW